MQPTCTCRDPEQAGTDGGEGVESTWERRARWAAKTAPQTLIRLSVGIEPVGDLLRRQVS
jgi:hypothetical protein